MLHWRLPRSYPAQRGARRGIAATEAGYHLDRWARRGWSSMPLWVFASVLASGSVPSGWKPIRGQTVKYPVRNAALLRYLRELLPGRWQKVIKEGTTGEVHYFEHGSGRVAGVKFYPKRTTR